jgi:RNA polymerase sigma-70 factor, ECF subfamily
MLHSIMTDRDDGAPKSKGRLHLVAADPRRADDEWQEAPGPRKQASRSAEATGDDSGAITILDRARAGDPEAFRAIFQRFGKPVLAFVFHYVDDRSRAEELTQETFLRAHCGLARMPRGVKLSTWLFGIARNVALEALRDRRRRRREVGLDDAASLTVYDGKAGPDDRIMSGELQGAIRRALADLSEDQRVVFVLKLISKMRYEEISQITGSSIGKLKTDLHRARQQMRERLQPCLAGTEPGK